MILKIKKIIINTNWNTENSLRNRLRDGQTDNSNPCGEVAAGVELTIMLSKGGPPPWKGPDVLNGYHTGLQTTDSQTVFSRGRNVLGVFVCSAWKVTEK